MKNRDGYRSFVEGKLAIAPTRRGLEVLDQDLTRWPSAFQRDLIRWALATGKAALFAGCGLGKTLMQLEWAHAIAREVGPVLILAPLAVSQQTVREGEKFGLPVVYAADADGVGDAPVVITNYERLAKFDASKFAGVVLDESGIIKNYSGKVKQRIFAAFRSTPFKLACTATPAPNDHMELGQHAEFLDVLTSHEMLARWFINDLSAFGTYRLKGHAARDFWDWTCSWARYVGTPADLGYSSEGYDLPGLQIHRHIVEIDQLADRGAELFRTPDLSATSVHKEKRRSIAARAARVAELVRDEPNEPWIVWCETDYEEDALREVLSDARVINGADSIEEKEATVMWFLDGRICTCGSRSTRSDVEIATQRTLPSESDASAKAPSHQKFESRTSASTRSGTASGSLPDDERSLHSETDAGASDTQVMSASAKRSGPRSRRGSAITPSDGSHSGSSHSGSLSTTTDGSSKRRTVSARSAAPSEAIDATDDFTSTTAIEPARSADSSAPTATRASASSPTIQSGSNAPRCTCGADPRVIISKASILGFGLNFQHCARMAFVGATFSYEKFYQAIRRCHRFGQKRPVDAHVVLAQTELPVWEILTRKSDDHELMAREMFAATRRATARTDDRAKAYEPRAAFPLASWIRTEEA